MPIRPKVLFFDVNETLLDLQAVKDSVTQALQGHRELVPVWFTTLLQYSLVATVGDRYVDFGKIGVATLQMVAAKNGLELTPAQANAALRPMRSLPPHPEVATALGRLKDAGYRLLALTNSGTEALEDQLTNAGLKPYFEDLLSVESVGKFKPHRDVYAWAVERVGVPPQECMLVAAHGWDVAGASWAGLQTAFVARPGQALYPLVDKPDYQVGDLAELVDQLS